MAPKSVKFAILAEFPKKKPSLGPILARKSLKYPQKCPKCQKMPQRCQKKPYIGAEVSKIGFFAGIFEKKGLVWTYIGAEVSEIGPKTLKMPKKCHKMPKKPSLGPILARKSLKFAFLAKKHPKKCPGCQKIAKNCQKREVWALYWRGSQ